MPRFSPSNPLFHSFAQTEVGVEETLLYTHLLTVIALLFAILVMGRVFLEHGKPSNVFAWMLLIFFVPWLGVPLYLLFSGRKNKKLMQKQQLIMN